MPQSNMSCSRIHLERVLIKMKVVQFSIKNPKILRSFLLYKYRFYLNE